MADALGETVKREGIVNNEERKLTIALNTYAMRLLAASPRGSERGLAPFLSCSAFQAADAPADESDELPFRDAAFRVALRRFVPEGTLSEDRFEFLVAAADKSWAEIIPKPKAQSIRDFLGAQFALRNKDDADAFGDYVVQLHDEAPTKVALSADMNGAGDAANLLIVETALCRLADAGFLAAAKIIFDNLRTQRAPPPSRTAPAPSVALSSGTSTFATRKDSMWLNAGLLHDLPLISDDDRSRICGSLPNLFLQ
jgi:hypothetical protein